MAKQLIFDAEAQEALRNGVQKLAKAVKSTLGPRGRTVVIDRGFGGPTITKDGYSVADEIQLSCPYENLGAQLLREAADKTNDVSGDGTTTSRLTPVRIGTESDWAQVASGGDFTEGLRAERTTTLSPEGAARLRAFLDAHTTVVAASDVAAVHRLDDP